MKGWKCSVLKSRNFDGSGHEVEGWVDRWEERMEGQGRNWCWGASPRVGMREPALCCAAFYKPQSWVYFRKEKGCPAGRGIPGWLQGAGLHLFKLRDFPTVPINTCLYLDSLRFLLYKFTYPQIVLSSIIESELSLSIRDVTFLELL